MKTRGKLFGTLESGINIKAECVVLIPSLKLKTKNFCVHYQANNILHL